MELSNYNRYNNDKDKSLTIIRERAKLNIQSDQGCSDQVIKSEFPLPQWARIKNNELVGLLTNLEAGCKRGKYNELVGLLTNLEVGCKKCYQ